MSTPSEVEIKIELPSSESVDEIKANIKNLGFAFAGRHILKEYYIVIKKSSFDGWDFERLRIVDDSRYLYTIKKWSHDKNDQLIRLEDEKEVTEEYSAKKIETGYELHFTKTREDFTNSDENSPSVVSFDTLTNSSKDRYFLECEVLVDQDDAHKARKNLKQWVRNNLNINPDNEAPSMIDIVKDFKNNA